MEIKRDFYLNKLISAKHDGLIKVVTGIRRCGKSYLLDPIFKDYLLSNGVSEDHIIKLELDKPSNNQYKDYKTLDNYIRSKIKDGNMYYVILDEVQLVEGFEFVLNGLLYERNIDIYVTGSNSKFLSSDIITEFRGRGENIHIYPLSFSEILPLYDGNEQKAWGDYTTYGGLPLVVLMNDNERKMNYLKDQSQNVYLNDVLERNNLKNDKNIITKLVEIISSSIGSLTNPKKISDTFKSDLNIEIASDTISKYLGCLEEAFLIEKAERYDIKGRKYIGTPSKYYFTDIGIRNSFINYRQYEETHIMENIIYLELKHRGYDVDVGLINHRQKENDEWRFKQLEIDFVANKGSNKIYIQSAFAIPDEQKRKQEETPLLKVNDSFKKVIITSEYTPKWYDENGILTMGLFEFLKNTDSLNSE